MRVCCGLALVVCWVCLLGVGYVLALDNGAAKTPPMGWSSWNAFHCNINHDQLLQVAAAMNASGMLAAGYSSLNIDDCW